MTRVGKLYKYYLKKSLWRSWRVWIAVFCCWVWWIGGAFVLSWVWRMKLKNEIKANNLPQSAEVIEEEYDTRGMINKCYQGAHLVDEKAVKWWQERTEKETDPTKQRFFTAMAKWVKERKKNKDLLEKLEHLSPAEREKVQSVLTTLDGSEIGPFNQELTELAAGRNSVSNINFWRTLTNISLWNVGGILAGMFLVYTLIDNLFVEPKKNGEEAQVLTLISPTRRGDLFVAKSLAYLTCLTVFTWLGFILPYTIFLLLGAGIVSVPAYLLLIFWTTIVGSLIFFLFPISIYLLISNLGAFGTIIYYLLTYFPLLWSSLNMILFWGSVESLRKGETNFFFATIAQIEYWYSHPFFYLPLAIIFGGLLLFLYYSYYQAEDLN